MKQYANNLNPRPLTVSGFKGESCHQANLPDNSRAPGKPTAKSQRRLKAKSRKCFSSLGSKVENDAIWQKQKCILKTYTGKQDFINAGVNEFKVSEYIDATGFRKESVKLTIYPEKTRTIDLKVHLGGFTHFRRAGCIYLSKSSQMSCRPVNKRFLLIASMHPDVRILGRNPFGWQKIGRIKWLTESVIRREYCNETGMEINNRICNN
jgi:hypothetical protein